ncbi:hypothetical protein AAFH68_26670 [Flavobacterium sp. CGRL1]|jgi:hypothetical protein
MPQIKKIKKIKSAQSAKSAGEKEKILFNLFNLWLNILFSNHMLDALQCIYTNTFVKKLN